MRSNVNKAAIDEDNRLEANLQYLKLTSIVHAYKDAATKAAAEQWSHVHYLAELVGSEVSHRHDQSTKRRIQQARFPMLKTLDSFDWNWPKKINRLQVQDLFSLNFVEQSANVIFLGGVGLGKTHLGTALAYQACLKGHCVLFACAIDIINNLAAAQSSGRFKTELKKYLKPSVLHIDELGYLPIDKKGADLLFQVISKVIVRPTRLYFSDTCITFQKV